MTDTNTALEAHRIADALEKCDWSGNSIGNKTILRAAVIALRQSPPAPDQEPTPYQVENLDKLADRIWSQGGGMTGKELLANVVNIMDVKHFGSTAQDLAQVHQFRKTGHQDWHDGIAPDMDVADGGGTYEVRTLYTRPQPDRVAELERALRSWEAELTRSIRHGLATDGWTAQEISDLVDANPTIIKIRSALKGGA